MTMTPIAASAFAGLLERSTGQQLVAGRRWRIEAALGPVMRAHGIASLDGLAAEAGRDRGGPLARKIVEALLNNETSFFRDAAVTQESHGIAMFALMKVRASAGLRRLRIWSAGCSTGQEVYSFAMGLCRMGDRLDGWDVSILGTDISHEALAQARRGVYSQMEVQRGLPIRELLDHFEADGDDWRFRRDPRIRISFVQHNLLDPPPGGAFDVISCRNVLLYFAADRRRQVFDRLAGSIAPDGILLLGAGETVLGQSDAFAADRDHGALYRKALPAALPSH